VELVAKKRIEYDLIILDVMMPEMDGFEACRKIREKSDAYIIFLTAKDEMYDKIAGLTIGGDDFITKPFEPRELLARMHSLFRRGQISAKAAGALEGIFKSNEFTFDMDRQILIRKEEELTLTTYEYLLLRYFCKNANMVLSRRQIENYLEENEFFSYGRSVDTGISRLRKKLEPDTKNPRILLTVWGRGYQLVVEKQ
jgi:two-component system OmpR family response regulator